MTHDQFKYLVFGISSLFGAALATGAVAQQAQVTQKGAVTIITLPRTSNGIGALDYKNAKPMALPSIPTSPGSVFDSRSASFPGKPQVVPGSSGTGQTTPTLLFPQSELLNSLGADPQSERGDNGGIAPMETGTAWQPYTTARVDLGTATSAQISRLFPYRPAGKLYFRIGESTFVCSASLITRGVIVTAAHCVAEWGRSRPYGGWQFVPAQYGNTAPYGVWNAAEAVILSSYYTGSPNLCSPAAPGVVCQDDVAVIRLVPQSGAFPGTRTGWYAYGYNGYGFTPFTGQAQITQLGYPVSHDSGVLMQRTESMGFTGPNYLASNTVIGSRQTGGSSGGPWLVNLGNPAVVLGGGITRGFDSFPNVIVGVTSWGYSSNDIKQMGASPFLSTNIVPVLSFTCRDSNPACR